jgi:hypothetical protein
METENTLTEKEIIRAATNDPALSARTFTLGERTFTVVDLEYDDYLKFLAYLQPLLEAVTAKIASIRGLQLDLGTGGGGMSASALIGFCGKDLPEMARLVCKGTDAGITVEEIKKLGKTPFRLSEIVIAQIEQNNIVKDMSDFFGQSLRLLTAALPNQN